MIVQLALGFEGQQRTFLGRELPTTEFGGHTRLSHLQLVSQTARDPASQHGSRVTGADGVGVRRLQEGGCRCRCKAWRGPIDGLLLVFRHTSALG